MGCHYYKLRGGALAHFLDSDDEFGCLCTFPHNNGEEMTADDVKSLALLGAAVAIAENDPATGEYVFIPGDLPDWIVDAVRRVTLTSPTAGAEESGADPEGGVQGIEVEET